ncbi:MAG TPA: flagellar protein FlgN [Aminobacterium sp.]|jgi:flagellar biosynthesis/type III secretory pathway chaperone|nr:MULTISPECIES: flagellar export chaperone FlgN [Aminobacterium]HCA41497.1 flagellar protein FlgN [Aminobacterium sp.]
MDGQSLVEVLLQQTDVLQKMHSVVVKQREALKEGRLELLQQLMKEQQSLAFEGEALEQERRRLAGRLSSAYHCAPTIMEFCSFLPEQEGVELREAAEALIPVVRNLQAEIGILSRLVDENRALSDILLAEWRRLEGMAAPGCGGLDMSV